MDIALNRRMHISHIFQKICGNRDFVYSTVYHRRCVSNQQSECDMAFLNFLSSYFGLEKIQNSYHLLSILLYIGTKHTDILM